MTHRPSSVTAIYNDQRRIGRSWELSGSNSPEPTLVLNEKPVEKHGSGVTYRLRLGAHCLYHAKSCLGEFYRKMKWRLSAVTATAHKLARIAGLSHMNYEIRLRTKGAAHRVGMEGLNRIV
jgi:hypothetical protein